MSDYSPGFMRSACGALLLGGLLWGCASHGSAVPSVAGSPGGAQSASGQSVTPNASGEGLPFEQALGKAFHSDADFAPYIDRDLVGKDRATALHLMKLMPPRMRADFVYIDSTGRMMSNRKAVIAGSHTFTYTVNNGSAASAASSGIRPMTYPPPLHTGTGPYLQTYAVQGVNAFLGYVKWKCNDMRLAGDDDPHIYSGGFGQDGQIDNGIDAGIKWVGGGSWNEDFVPFLAYSTTGFKYNGWVPNDTQHYSCDNNVGIMYGVVDSQYVMLMVGYPDYSPEQYTLPPAAATWHHGSWIFYQTPSAFYQPGFWQGNTTPCTSCYVKRMVSIAQDADYFQDGSCFGACDGSHMTIRWDQTVMGQLIQPCHGGSQSATCTIQFYTDFPSPRWYGGFKPYPAPGGVFWNENYFNAYEGINLGSQFANDSGNELAPDGTFAGSLPPEPASCTLDAYGYCDTPTGTNDDGTVSCFDGLHWHNYPNTRTSSYDIYGSNGYIETADSIETFSDGGDGNCPAVDWSWDPQEPSQQFGDPNLP